jgi:hypothetical protein
MNRLAFLALIPLFALGCSRGPQLSTPDDFAELERGENHAFRATNASGVVLGVRSEKNDPRGNLDFWSQALDHKLQKGGYKKTGASAVTTNGGLAGKRMRYEVERGGRVSEYWITVFVTQGEVVVVEAGGDSAFFDEETEKRVDHAIRTLDLG